MPLIVVRVTAEARSVEEFIARYARYFRDGEIVFVPTEGVQPSGRRVKFVFALADGTEVLCGEGVVMRMRRDSGDPRRPPGMELRYEISDEASAKLIERLLAARKTPPPYVSMRIDGVADSQELTLPIERGETAPSPPPPTPSLPSRVALPSRTPVPLARAAHPLPPITMPPSASLRPSLNAPSLAPVVAPHSSRAMRLAGTAVATAAAILAVTLAAAIMRRTPALTRPHATGVGVGVGVGGNGVTVAAAPSQLPEPSLPEPPAVAAPPVVTGPRPESTGGARAAHATELRVTTSPPGALVFVDGEERGTAPLAIAVAAGAHDVVAERPRWNPAHAHVDGPGHVQLVLSRPQARLRFVSTPPGATVRLDGHDIGVTPLELDADAYEQHSIRLRARRPHLAPQDLPAPAGRQRRRQRSDRAPASARWGGSLGSADEGTEGPP